MIELIDTHQHLLYRDTFQYLWADDLPALAERDFTVADYAGLTDGKGVAGSIFMEVDAQDYKAEARFIADIAKDPSNRILGLIVSGRPEEPLADFDAWLDECAGMPVVGLRRILHEAPDDVSQSRQFRENIARLGLRDLVFDICVRADQLALARDLARSCPQTRFVLDHCGVPDIAGGEMETWREGILQIAKEDSVVCKLSGVLAYCPPDAANIDAIGPYISHVIECFGPDRLMWGSDWPVVNTKSTLPVWIDMFRTLIAGLSEGEQRKICSGTAERVYGVSL